MSGETEHAPTGEAPKPEPITFVDMIDAIWAEACRIRGTQDALVASGLRAYRNTDELRRADIFEAASKVLMLADANKDEFRAMVRRNKAR